MKIAGLVAIFYKCQAFNVTTLAASKACSYPRASFLQRLTTTRWLHSQSQLTAHVARRRRQETRASHAAQRTSLAEPRLQRGSPEKAWPRAASSARACHTRTISNMGIHSLRARMYAQLVTFNSITDKNFILLIRYLSSLNLHINDDT